MQNQVLADRVTIDYDSFEQFFRENSGRVHFSDHCPPLRIIRELHHHDALELGYCFEGSGVFWIDGVQTPYTAPCASLIFPGQLHKACSTGSRLSRWRFITIRAEAGLPAGVTGGVFTEPGLLALAERAAAECAAGAAHYEACVRHLMAAIVLIYARTAPAKQETAERRNRMERLQPVLHYISQNYAQGLTIQGLAQVLYVHPSTLRVWFREAFGMSPLQYVQHTRISRACALLQSTSMPIGEVAQTVGYQTLSSFNRQFSALCGCSPQAYRKREREVQPGTGKIQHGFERI